MTADQSLAEHVLDLLGNENSYSAKRMFGGYGLFKDDLMFGIISDGNLYLKSDDQNRERFTSIGLPPFRYQRKGKTVSLSYYQAPAEALDTREAIQVWVRSAIAAAQRNEKKKKTSR